MQGHFRCRAEIAIVRRGAVLLTGTSAAAQVLAGGRLPSGGAVGQFYPPTVLVGVTRDMRIWQEEVFGPVAVIVVAADDDDMVALANDCPFGLGSAVWCRDARRAKAISRRIEVRCCGHLATTLVHRRRSTPRKESICPRCCPPPVQYKLCRCAAPGRRVPCAVLPQAGMTSINDFATTYMCQSLPFGGVKDSGFDRFAGVEGLRGLCVVKAVAEDRSASRSSMRSRPSLKDYPPS